jgi:anionic cell wall polymer biosynthesis LytR-Cps2A-Psr (LCP) family protein
MRKYLELMTQQKKDWDKDKIESMSTISGKELTIRELENQLRNNE